MKSAKPQFSLAAAPALEACREASLARLAGLRARLAAEPVPGVLAVVAAGSLGRLEAHGTSDFDAVVIVEEDVPAAALAPIFDAAAAHGLRPPKPGGIFREGVTPTALLQPDARGSLAEPPAIFGKRMQLLLDARPAWGEAAFLALRRQVLDWYRDARGEWWLLLDDLQRYLHAYAGWQRYKFNRDADDGWYLRQAKLRGSRMLTFAGLLYLLGEASRQPPARALAWLEAHLDLTPLERLHAVMEAGEFAALLADYEAVHARLCDPAVREALIATSPAGLDALPHAWPEPYASIEAACGRLLETLARGVLARREAWGVGFFVGVLF